METQTVLLYETASNALVEAVLHSRLTAEQVLAAEESWRPHRATLDEHLEHGHWDWARKVPQIDRPGSRFLGIEFGGLMQGMMAIWESGYVARLPLQYGQPLVYVDYIEVAPWNLEVAHQIPKYRAVGTRLMRRAILFSVECGYDGRLGLVSLPDAEGFYERKFDMIPVGLDPEYNHELMRYELTPDRAGLYLRRRS